MKTVELFLEKYNLLQPKNNIIVAFSGGYDSTCLLDIMKKLKAKYGFNLIAVHLNHNWRGTESDKEEEKCKEFCKDIIFYSEKLPIGLPKTETTARDERYKFFEKCAKKYNSDAILTAHNANDNAETLFYRIMKGTGLTGLEGIKEKRDIYYRPLLTVYRSEIEQYCANNVLEPNSDSSNFNTKYIRNKIRHDIFPDIESFAPDFIKNLNQLSASAIEINKVIDGQIKELEKYSTTDFLQLDKNLQTEVIHRFYRQYNLDYDRKKIENCLDFILKNSHHKSGKTYSLANEKWLFVSNKKLELVMKECIESNNVTINKEGIYRGLDYKFEIRKANKLPKKFPQDSDMKAYIEVKEIDFELRKRNDGDVIQPLGMDGKLKLKKYLTEKEIPKHEKDKMLFLCNKNEVLWVPGYGISEKVKVVAYPTYVLKLDRSE